MSAADRARLRQEITLVLLLSLGQSAIYSVLALVRKLTEPVRLNQQVTALNKSVAPDRVWLDVLYQVAGVTLPLMPVALCFYLLSMIHPPAEGAFKTLGFDARRPWSDLGRGFAIFAGIGIPGIALYVGAVLAGLNTQVDPSNPYWWMIPFLILRAAMNGILEEVIMLGYFFTRWTQSGGKVLTVLLLSAFIRGGYHLYQGFGGFVGNLIMGLIFGALYLRWKRVMPLVVAHTFLDIAAFLGAPLLPLILRAIGLG